MRIGLVSGDGLPVSGLLTIFRNVVDLGVEWGLLASPVPAELGYSWRPDKPGFFPYGPRDTEEQGLLAFPAYPAPDPGEQRGVGTEWTRIRTAVAHADRLGVDELADARRRIDALAWPYRAYFRQWMQDHDLDWVCAVNMTLSDAVPVTAALHRAARERYSRRPGGVLFWDHDLFGSCAVLDDEGVRMYPERPNCLTPLPDGSSILRWAVVSDALASEAAEYPVPARPAVVPNILPRVPAGPLDRRHREFLSGLGLVTGRPVLLDPVRVFRVKGVEIALELLAATRAACAARDQPLPYLLVFGNLKEDPAYAREVLATAARLGVQADVRFLDGVPLHTSPDAAGRWRLNEVDLLRLAAASGGGVVFTPNTRDVETIGLGPALAAVAGVPCAVSSYDAFDAIYGRDFRAVAVGSSPEALRRAGEAFAAALQAYHRRSPAALAELRQNRRIVERGFPVEPWTALLRELATAAAGPLPARPAG